MIQEYVMFFIALAALSWTVGAILTFIIVPCVIVVIDWFRGLGK